ncbi:MFS transporter [Undibacterium arcticum]
MHSTQPPALRQDAKVIGLIGIGHGVSHFSSDPGVAVSVAEGRFPVVLRRTGVADDGVFFIVSGIGQALAGFVVDRVGARRVLFGGLGCLAVSALALSSAQTYPMLLAGSMLAGLGNSVFHPADFSLLNKRVSAARIGHAFSVHGVSGNLGWAAAPLFLTGIAGLSSWRSALVAAAFIPLAVLLLLVLNRDALRTDDPRPHTSPAAVAASNSDLFDFLRLPTIWMCFTFFVITALATGGIQSFFRPPACVPCTACRWCGRPPAIPHICWRRLPVWCWADSWRRIQAGPIVSLPVASSAPAWSRC